MLLHYRIDLRHLNACEQSKVISYIEPRVETNLVAEGNTGFYTFFLDENINPESVIPAGVPVPRQIQ